VNPTGQQTREQELEDEIELLRARLDGLETELVEVQRKGQQGRGRVAGSSLLARSPAHRSQRNDAPAWRQRGANRPESDPERLLDAEPRKAPSPGTMSGGRSACIGGDSGQGRRALPWTSCSRPWPVRASTRRSSSIRGSHDNSREIARSAGGGADRDSGPRTSHTDPPATSEQNERREELICFPHAGRNTLSRLARGIPGGVRARRARRSRLRASSPACRHDAR